MSTTVSPSTLVDVDPGTLLIDVNVRTAARLDKDFLASIRDLGVLVPIVAVRTTDGDVRVRYGHRRTLAAVEATLPTVPVVIAGDEGTDDAATIERLIGQFAENQHRTGLTTAERISTANQMALLGVPAAKITKSLRMPRADVDAALKTAKSALATAAVDRYDFLTIDQAAAVAEFEDDEDTVKALIAAAKTGQFEHVAQRARDQRAREDKRAAFIQALQEAGVALAANATGTGQQAVSLDLLTDQEGQPLTAENHHQCPGHAARVFEGHGYVDPATGFPPEDSDDPDDAEDDGLVYGSYPIASYVCIDPAAHGHKERWGTSTGQSPMKAADMSDEDREAARAARRDVIESNKAWTSAETVRRNWLRTFLARKTAPKGTAPLIATALCRDPETMAHHKSNRLAAELLGAESQKDDTTTVLDLITKAGAARAQVLALALTLAGYETATHKGSWRNIDPRTRTYLEFLAANGYTLSTVERRACGQDPLPETD